MAALARWGCASRLRAETTTENAQTLAPPREYVELGQAAVVDFGMRFGSGLALVCTLYACGGKTETNDPGIHSTGGTSGTTTSAAGGCSISQVAFQIKPATDSTISWCLGSPGSSGKCHATDIRDGSGSLELTQQAPRCDDCHGLILPPGSGYEKPYEIAPEGNTVTWTGRYYVSAISTTCGEQAFSCWSEQCAAPGQYAIDVCGFLNPNPTWLDGCQEAGDQTPVTVVSTTFDLPTSAPVVVTMPSSL